MQSELYGRRQRNYKHWHDRDYAVSSFMICNIYDLLFWLMRIGGRGGVFPIAAMLRAWRTGSRIPVGDSLISKHFPNGSAHPASTWIRTRAPFWGQCGQSVTLTTHLPLTAVWDSVDMGKTLYRNGYIFIIIRYVLNNFSVCIQSWQPQQHTRLHISKTSFTSRERKGFFSGSCTQDRTPWRIAWESGAPDVRRRHRFIEWNWGFLSWRPGSTLIVPNLFHTIVNIQPATNKHSLCNCKSPLFSGFTKPAGSLLCSPLTSIMNSLHAYAFIIYNQILIHSLKLPHRPDFLTFPKLEFWTQHYFREEYGISIRNQPRWFNTLIKCKKFCLSSRYFLTPVQIPAQ